MSSSLTTTNLTIGSSNSSYKTSIDRGYILLKDSSGEIEMSTDEYGGDITVSHGSSAYQIAKIHVNDDESGPFAFYIGFANTAAPKLNPDYIVFPKNTDEGWKMGIDESNGELKFWYDTEF